MQYISFTIPNDTKPSTNADLVLDPVVVISEADAFDGFDLPSIIVDLSARIPLIAGSLAATLVAINKSIDEARKIALGLRKQRKQSRIIIDGEVCDLEDLDPKEINRIFDEARHSLLEKAKADKANQ